MLAITYTKITKIRVAEWGTPKKIIKKKQKQKKQDLLKLLKLIMYFPIYNIIHDYINQLSL